mgnify:CR=1 FL=1
MCIHTKLRQKRLCPILIKELTRRGELKGYWQAQYTQEETVPNPFSQAQYFHRQLNPYKNIEVGFVQN